MHFRQGNTHRHQRVPIINLQQIYEKQRYFLVIFCVLKI